MRENALPAGAMGGAKMGEPPVREISAPSMSMPSIAADSDEEAQSVAGTRALREGPDLERRYPLALALYALLAALVWFTMDASKIVVLGRPVELRLVPLIVIGGLALRTVLARQAERVRRQGAKDSY
jgi:hypothetical protein